MARIRCFMIEPTDQVRQYLRRYHSSAKPGAACPLMPGQYSYHNARVQIEDAPAIFDAEHQYVRNGVDNVGQYKDDARWPTHCACGYAFTEVDARQLFVDLIYRRPDSGEEMTTAEAPAGAMWYAAWAANFFHAQLPGGPLIVKLPGGTDWQVDSMANNCTMSDDFKQERHHCWVIEGTPPDVSVSKNGPTCGAGAGSIAAPGYHGFLRNGWLED